MGFLDGRSVLLTGGGSGLGRAIVERFVAEGARLTVLDRSEDKLAALRHDLGDTVRTVPGDVTSYEDNEAAVSAALDAFGALDVFVGNVGLWDFGSSLAGTDAEQLSKAFDELFAVNVKGYLLGAKAAHTALRETRGSMIFTLSNAAFYPVGGGPLYVTSKHAGVGLVRQLAYELAPEIRVNAVAPGGMATDLRGPSSLGQQNTSIAEALPIDEIVRTHGALQRAADPRDYVGFYLLLASAQDALTTTGTVIDISSLGVPRRNAEFSL
ncbi:3-(cis-5,6-dihydroxycyclohexa-1,3-dien-1-yl)propanoate dehydrogenase [Streptomyces sp. NPDC091215]|uniref:3-(cis-5,6-dihydroxycyclohexa-1, 3-dien-1-yl)propanoate dehydrogenase n=1 Tax=Streptomyces sp. NPDC091215 TaxID=3155192 RepID=UPI003429DC4A